MWRFIVLEVVQSKKFVPEKLDCPIDLFLILLITRENIYTLSRRWVKIKGLKFQYPCLKAGDCWWSPKKKLEYDSRSWAAKEDRDPQHIECSSFPGGLKSKGSRPSHFLTS